MGGNLRVGNAKAPAGRGFGEAKKNRFRGGLFQEIRQLWPFDFVGIARVLWNVAHCLSIKRKLTTLQLSQ
ncbi:hypothetical protein BMH52_19845 [Pseudomonas sp. BTN1]|nr:hypothetical protein BMH52_19845 [Pseudomonas sp. BTN1]